MQNEKTIRTALIALALVAWSDASGQLLDADVRTFSVQALLTDEGGTPLPGPTVDLEFRVYDDLDQLVEGPIVMNGVSITNGLINVMLPVSPSSIDGSLRLVGITVDPPDTELTPRIQLGAVPHAFRVDRVASEELDDNITLGGPADAGSLTVYGGGVDSEGSIDLMQSVGGAVLGRLYAFQNRGQFALSDDAGEQIVALGNPSLFGGTGGLLHLYMDRLGSFGDNPGASLVGDDGDSGALWLRKLECDPFCAVTTTVIIDGDAGNGGGEILLGNGSGVDTITLQTNAGGTQAAIMSTYSDSGTIATQFGTGALGDGALEIFQDDGTRGVAGTGDSPFGGGGRLRLWDDGGDETVDLRANFNGAGTGAWMALRADGLEGITMAAESATSGVGGLIEVKNDTGAATVQIMGDTGGGGLIEVKNGTGATTVQILGDTGGGFGRVRSSVIEITGGSDLSESFDVSGDAVAPGMVMIIDPDHPGRLMCSTQPYDSKVAGIVSGAGGVRPGMVMGQAGSVADGSHHVALTGRVYCWCDASAGAIQPGDRLTTSLRPGHAMKVQDGDRCAGAVIGKAMTSLDEGCGLVLVLVQPQ